MSFNLNKVMVILEGTPNILNSMVRDLPDEFIKANEGGETWNIFDVIGHLVHGEKTDWIPRTEIILSPNSDKNFPQFDRFAQFEESKGKSLAALLNEFEGLRKLNIDKLRSKNLKNVDLDKTGIHPAFGKVSLSQLLATWVVHDLDHISQISRILAKRYKDEVGPWIEYLKILKQ